MDTSEAFVAAVFLLGCCLFTLDGCLYLHESSDTAAARHAWLYFVGSTLFTLACAVWPRAALSSPTRKHAASG